MSAGLSTTIQITFTPQVNKDINDYFPILAETGPINIPLVCTCKKALLSVENPHIDFGNVIFQEKLTKSLKIKNSGALPTQIFVKTEDSRSIPFLSREDLEKREAEWNYRKEAERKARLEEHERKKEERKNAREAAPSDQDNSFAAEEDEEKEVDQLFEQVEKELAEEKFEIGELDEFITQVSFKRTTEIDGYKSVLINFTFEPYKLMSFH